ncbi:MAG: hypothetical protein JWQ09_982 [Segetibacter sp.]|nr:hypothetical protein [Segetibacter sp.]
MKKIFTLATAALIFTGAAFAHEGKKCAKGKSCCSKKEAGKKTDIKDVKTTASLKKA